MYVEETPTRVQYQAEEWQPGEPLWMHPWRDDGGSQAVRYIFDLLEEGTTEFVRNTMMRCDRCDVSWHAYEGWSPTKPGPSDRATGAVLTCWMCGERGKYPSDP